MVNRLSSILCDEVCSSVPCYAPADVARWSLLALLPPLPPCPPSASAGSLRYSGRTMRSRALFAILGEPPNIVPCWFNELHLRYFIEMCEPRLGRLPHRCGPGQVRCRPHCSQPCQCQAQTQGDSGRCLHYRQELETSLPMLPGNPSCLSSRTTAQVRRLGAK